MNRIVLLLLLLLLAGTLCAQRTRHVVIVVVDGVRYSETFGNPTHQWIPRLWTILRPQGTMYTSYTNDGLTETNPGHASIATGMWQNIANTGLQRPNAPTIFEYFRKERGTSADENVVVLGKTKLDILAYGEHPMYGPPYQATVKYSPSQYSDPLAFDNLKSAVQGSHARLMIVNLPASDNAGHSGDWGSYVTALRAADSLVGEIWSLVQSDSVMKGRTTMVVTNDHGRHLDGVSTGFRDHGDGCEGCRHIMLLVVGPDTPAGRVDSSKCSQIDVAPTVGALLGFSPLYATGKVITSAILAGVGGENPGLPPRCELAQNYPNPFNPTTTIQFSLAEEARVSVRIFDLLGRETAIPCDGIRPAGTHAVRFDARDLASGVYVYRLEVFPARSTLEKGSVLSRRMVLTK